MSRILHQINIETLVYTLLIPTLLLVGACSQSNGEQSQCNTIFYEDLDSDNLGDPAITSKGCVTPDGFVENADDAQPDCGTNDTDDCGICGGSGPDFYYDDSDGDGLGDPTLALNQCHPPAGFVRNHDDLQPHCPTNDTDICGGCGGPGYTTFYPDADGDGLGDGRSPIEACQPPPNYADNPDDLEPDCPTNDTDPCGICAGPGMITFYEDADNDGLGDPEHSVQFCEEPPGFVPNADDTQPSCHSNDIDICGVCGGTGPAIYYPDADGDGLGDGRSPVEVCGQPPGYVANDQDTQPDCGTNDTDDCGVCAGANADMDCLGLCFGDAALDGCNICAGGFTGVEPQTQDFDNDNIPDLCDQCPSEPMQRFIIQFTDVMTFNGNGGPYTFEIILHENGDILFQYKNIDPLDPSATIGFQSASGVHGLEFGFNNRFLTERPVIFAQRGGPEQFMVEYEAPMAWMDIQALGTPIELADDQVVALALPFEFPFFTNSFASTNLSSNGYIAFSGTNPGYDNLHLPNETLGDFIAILWDDLNPAARSGQIHTYLVGETCEQDCAGVFGGIATFDVCGDCMDNDYIPGANTDCNNDCYGDAYFDFCGVCVGGNTGLEASDPATCPRGPDLIVGEDLLVNSLSITTITVAENDCYISEGCVQGPGERKVIQFGTRIANIGNEDLRLGVPGDFDFWHYDECHGHYHFSAYAAYELFDAETQENLEVGFKNGFAVVDSGVYDPEIATEGCLGYNGSNQGISAGCHDTYGAGTACNWIDITDISDGTYDLLVKTNPDREIEELNYDNNSVTVRVQIAGDEINVVTP